MGQLHPNYAGPQCIVIGQRDPALTQQRIISAGAERRHARAPFVDIVRRRRWCIYVDRPTGLAVKLLSRFGFASAAAYLREIGGIQQDLLSQTNIPVLPHCRQGETETLLCLILDDG